MPTRTIPDRAQLADIAFPTLGLDVSGAYQLQPPGTTPSESNVRTFEPLTQRGRGGSRPGVLKYIPAVHPSGTTLIQEINVLTSSSKAALPNQNLNLVQSNVTNFPDSTGTTYVAKLIQDVTAGDLLVMLISINGTPLTANTPTDSLGNSWQDGNAVGPPGFGTAGDNNTLRFYWTIAGASGQLTVTWTYDHVTAGSHRASIGLIEYQYPAPSFPFDSRIARNANDVPYTNLTTSAITTSTSLDLIIGAWSQCEGVQTFTCPANQNIRINQPDGTTYGGLYVVDRPNVSATGLQLTGTLSPGTLDNVVSFGIAFKTIAGTANLQASASGRINTIIAIAGGFLASSGPGLSTWTLAKNNTGRTPPFYYQSDDQVVVRSAQNGAALFIVDGHNYAYFNTSNELNNWTATTDGTIPFGPQGYAARLICTWRARTVLAGFLDDPISLYFSAITDPFNWNFAPAPPPPTNLPNGAQAVRLSASPAGLPSDPITAIFPYTDDVLIIGCSNSIWLYQGDPAQGGQLVLVTDTIGIAWGIPGVKGPDGTFYFFSGRCGIFAFVPGQQPQRISQQIQPLLTPINTGTTTIRLAWDDQNQGLFVFITHSGSITAETHYFWEARVNAWRPVQMGNNNLNPQCCCVITGNSPADRVVAIGSWDGYVRAFDNTATTDDTTAISSYVLLGPILTKMMDNMMLRRIVAILGAESGNVNYEVYVGDTAAAALASSRVYPGPNDTATFGAGRNVLANIRRSGHVVWIKLLSTVPWAFEQMNAEVFSRGALERRRLQS